MDQFADRATLSLLEKYEPLRIINIVACVVYLSQAFRSVQRLNRKSAQTPWSRAQERCEDRCSKHNSSHILKSGVTRHASHSDLVRGSCREQQRCVHSGHLEIANNRTGSSARKANVMTRAAHILVLAKSPTHIYGSSLDTS